jgi:transcriptional regulator with XRE-family HTH domain
MIEERLKNYINSKYESVSDFCIRTGIANSTLQTVFKRGVKNTSSKTIFKICNALDLDVNALYDGEIKPNRPDRKVKTETVDIFEYVGKLENMTLLYKGEEIQPEQKRMMLYGFKIAIEMSMKL